MKQLIPMDEHGMFADCNDTALVDSRFVAEAFEKRHDHVLRTIDQITAPNSGLSKEFIRRNFTPISYKDSTGRTLRCYALTRDGFTILAMGFTGSKAMRFKEMYVRRFNEMEKFISALVSAREQFPKLTAQIRLLHPDAKSYHYSNECDMLNRIVLGMSAKQFREAHGLEKGHSIRPHLRDDQIAMLDLLQTVDIGLLLAIPNYQQRKRQLEWYAMANAGRFGTTPASVSLLTERVLDE
jgi:Rha family phage regulatory protein